MLDNLPVNLNQDLKQYTIIKQQLCLAADAKSGNIKNIFLFIARYTLDILNINLLHNLKASCILFHSFQLATYIHRCIYFTTYVLVYSLCWYMARKKKEFDTSSSTLSLLYSRLILFFDLYE